MYNGMALRSIRAHDVMVFTDEAKDSMRQPQVIGLMCCAL